MFKSFKAIAVLSILSSCLAAGVSHAQDHPLLAAAQKEGSVTIYSALPSAFVQKVGSMFEQKYGIKVNVFAAGGAQVEQKIALELRAQRVAVDVLEIFDPSVINRLADQGAIAPYTPLAAKQLDPRFLDSKHRWTAATGNIYPIIYNNKQVSPQDAPKTYKDLADPKWKNKLALASPNFGASQTIVMRGFVEQLGWDFISALKANQPLIARGFPDLENVVITGERLVGPDTSSRTFVALQQKQPISVVIPPKGVLTSVGALGVMKQSKSPNAARLLLDYYLSDDVQGMVAEFGLFPVMAGAPSPAGFPRLDQMDLYFIDIEELQKERSAMIDKWTTMLER